jgi:hypothetical protein
MKISYDGTTVTFKTEPKELFDSERSGTKPNTVRILDIDEYLQLRKRNPKKIIIQYQQEIFLRSITNIHATKGVFGKVIVVISWRDGNPLVSAISPHSVPVEPGPHNASVDPVPEAPTTPPISKCTNCIWGLRENRDNGLTGVAPKSPDELTPVLLPRTLVHDLGRFRQDGSHADFIRKLLIAHLNKLIEEGGPMHD